MSEIKKDKAVALWLFVTALAVALMVLVGGITRLTESGLSIVEWKPITGALPPLNEAAWQSEFSLYQQSPQYLKINHGMSLEEFKGIFFWEWLHRLWGRLIGFIYLVPFIYFAARKRLPRETWGQFVGLFALGLVQGGIGWFMVKSGLRDNPAVSHYRLALHLMTAVLIYLFLIRAGLRFMAWPQRAAVLKNKVYAVVGLVAVTMTWGAFTAGLRAGRLYNTFPKMNEYWLPPELFSHVPLWMAFIEEPAVVQFSHRLLALSTFMAALALVAYGWKRAAEARPLLIGLGGVAFLQVILGVSTLISEVNIVLAVAHQAGAVVLLSVLMLLL